MVPGGAFHQVAVVERAAAVLKPAHPFQFVTLHDLHVVLLVQSYDAAIGAGAARKFFTA